MKCPFCGEENTKVIDSRPAEENNSIRRRRQCEVCGKRFTTYEKVETIPLIVIKKDDNREPYDRSKIERGIVRSCHKRPVSYDQIVSTVEEIEAEIFNKEEKEIITKIMEKYGEKVDLEGQKTYDAVGCDYCNNTGFYSRIGIFETLDVTDEIRELIVRGASSMEIRQKALETGYRPLVVDGIKKVIEGVTTLEELNKKILMY